MKIIKIAILENSGYDFYTSRLRYALFLEELNYKVYVIVPNDGYVKKIRDKGINVIEVGANIRGTGLFNKIQYAFDLIRIFKQNHFNIIHTYRLQPNIIGTFLAGIFTKSKIINHITGLGTAFNYSSFKYKLMQLITISLYKTNYYLFEPISIFQNKQDIKDLGISKKSYCVKGSAVNEERFCDKLISVKKRNIIEKKFDILQNETISFLFVSRLLLEKGVFELIEAFKLASKENKIQLLIVGWFDRDNNSSVNENFLNEMISGHDNIKLLGKQTDIPEIISLSDVSILPTYYREGTPRFLLESMAMKKPIITTRMPGCEHLIRNGENGILIEPRSVQEIKMAINDICKKELKKMGMNSYKIYKSEFSEKIVYNSLLKIYKSLQNQ